MHAIRCSDNQCALLAGRLMILDGRSSVNISTWEKKVTLDRPGCGVNGRFCDFIELPQPYSSMWLLSRERVRHYVTSAYWRCGA